MDLTTDFHGLTRIIFSRRSRRFLDEHEPMEQREQSKRACNLPSRDRGGPKVNFTN